MVAGQPRRGAYSGSTLVKEIMGLAGLSKLVEGGVSWMGASGKGMT